MFGLRQLGIGNQNLTMKSGSPSQIRFDGHVYFHIGPHKTGTTSIQTFLQKNSGSLKEQGILYPTGGRSFLNGPELSDRSRLLIFHHPLVMDLFDKNTDKVTAHVQAIQSEIDEHQPNLVVISSEVLARPAVTGSFVYQDLRRIFVNADRSWVLYLRRQDDLLVSLFTEGLKRGGNPWPKSILDSESVDALDHKARLQKLESVIESDRLIVKSFEREKPSIVESFLDELGVDSTDDFRFAEKERQSASARAINLQRLANCLPFGSARFRSWALRLDRSMTKLGFESSSAHSLLNDHDRVKLRHKYQATNLYVENRYFVEKESGLLIDD
ncbi:hypothetical protein [Ruegeria arenilitoris]|uniref:hypothetical protein n=2 Tax=Ruegeria arenilitoris TaxID=1173585 RepID=UPI00147E0346|nr:hypothetical protein [Ruegeria arenilitoris]